MSESLLEIQCELLLQRDCSVKIKCVQVYVWLEEKERESEWGWEDARERERERESEGERVQDVVWLKRMDKDIWRIRKFFPVCVCLCFYERGIEWEKKIFFVHWKMVTIWANILVHRWTCSTLLVGAGKPWATWHYEILDVFVNWWHKFKQRIRLIDLIQLLIWEGVSNLLPTLPAMSA